MCSFVFGKRLVEAVYAKKRMYIRRHSQFSDIFVGKACTIAAIPSRASVGMPLQVNFLMLYKLAMVKWTQIAAIPALVRISIY